ncbi:MAG TPA: sigma-70 family RNA polymerase sigma factor [Terriglobales bacterium]|nr:sigma-70 family RNA polymerase sigma factor [Terriglobales bacterium]
MASTAQSLTEQVLIERVKAGEPELFYQLIEPYQRAVFSAAYSVLGNEADAEDVAQEAFLKAYSRLDQFRGECKFSTWLIQITINEARMRRRKDRKALYDSIDEGYRDESGDYFPIDFADWREIPSDAVEQKELKDALSRAITSLKPIYREVFILRDVQGLNIRETSEALGINEALVRTRLLRARLQMRDALAPGYDGSWTTGSTSYKKVRPF